MAAKKKVEEVAVEAPVEEAAKEEKIEESAALTSTVNGDNVSNEGFDISDFIEGSEMTLSQIPTLKLTQALTPEVTSGEYEDIRPGMFIDDVTKEVLGTEVKFRLIMMWRQRVKFPPREEGSNTIECSCPTANRYAEGDIGSTYGPCAKCNYLNFDAKDHCQPQYTIVVALNNDPHALYRIILSRTSLKAGKVFGDAFQTQYNRFSKYKLPLFMFEGILRAKKVKNPKINAVYYVNDLEVIPVTEVPTMEAELKEEFMQTCLEVRELRKNQIETGLTIAKENMEKRAEENTDTESFKEINSNLAADMGLEDVPEAEENEKVPF